VGQAGSRKASPEEALARVVQIDGKRRPNRSRIETVSGMRRIVASFTSKFESSASFLRNKRFGASPRLSGLNILRDDSTGDSRAGIT
jgi:hypothetical protein